MWKKNADQRLFLSFKTDLQRLFLNAILKVTGGNDMKICGRKVYCIWKKQALEVRLEAEKQALVRLERLNIFYGKVSSY